MYAVVETGSKQFKVAKNDIFAIELIDAKDGGEITLDKVLLAKDGNAIHVGTPYLKDTHVVCEVLGHTRLDKVVSFKYKKRKSEKKKIGHRQNVIKLKVKEIVIAK